MTQEELAALLRPATRVPDKITITALNNRQDRTLLRGQLYNGENWHVFVQNGQIQIECRVKDEKRAGQELFWDNKFSHQWEWCEAEGCAYWMHRRSSAAYGKYEISVNFLKLDAAACDFEFCALLKRMGVLPEFLPATAPKELVP